VEHHTPKRCGSRLGAGQEQVLLALGPDYAPGDYPPGGRLWGRRRHALALTCGTRSRGVKSEAVLSRAN
jgi:hypothetical protein